MEFNVAAIEAAAHEGSFTGVVAVHRGAALQYERCFGLAHRALGIPVTPDTRFALASGSKTFTALGVLRLVESGRLALADRVRPILGGDLPLIDDAVTIEQLLTHCSGIGDYLAEDDGWDAADYVLPVPVHTLGETTGFLPVVDGFPQAFAPGERFSYCNGGYIVLALVIERVSGLGYHEFLQAEVFDRAGLAATGFPRSDELPGDAALGYLDVVGGRTNVLHLPVRGNGDGGAYSTVGDLRAFWEALVAGRIVGADTLAAMIRPRFEVPDEGLRYGLGVYLQAAGPALLMEGYDAGVSMLSIHDPVTHTTASVLGNSSEGAWPIAGVLVDAFG